MAIWRWRASLRLRVFRFFAYREQKTGRENVSQRQTLGPNPKLPGGSGFHSASHFSMVVVLVLCSPQSPLSHTDTHHHTSREVANGAQNF
jgi:hypothetical protein